MALNGILMNGLVQEFNDKLVGGRINKIYQPNEDELTIIVRNNGQNYHLFITINNNFPHLSIVDDKKDNPMQPPNFCMLLRKHLQNGFIEKVEQMEFERVLTFSINSADELGYVSTKHLVVEIMGKHSNIILVDPSKNKILDSIKRVPPALSRVRPVLPNKEFKYLAVEKENILALDRETFDSLLTDDQPKVFQWLYYKFQGFGPKLSKEICTRASVDFDLKIKEMDANELTRIYNELINLKSLLMNKEFKPVIIIDNKTDEKVDFSFDTFDTYHSEDYKQVVKDDFSAVINEYFQFKMRNNRIKQKSGNLRKIINNRLEVLRNKIGKLETELATANNAEEYKIKGELLTANIYKIERGMKKITVPNYMDDNKEMTIELKPNQTPANNAQRYYKKYNKLKNAQTKIKNQLIDTKNEIKYLENIQNSLENAEDLDTVAEIKSELAEEGLINTKHKEPKKKTKKDKLKEYVSSEGFTIYAGKNNKQNDFLTLKFANNSDIWLHTKDLAGTHVIIVTAGREVPEQTLKEAAIVAAYNSKGKMSSNVPVDYTRVKHVSKPSGAKPGMVIYKNNKTLYVTPKKNIINKLKKEE